MFLGVGNPSKNRQGVAGENAGTVPVKIANCLIFAANLVCVGKMAAGQAEGINQAGLGG